MQHIAYQEHASNKLGKTMSCAIDTLYLERYQSRSRAWIALAHLLAALIGMPNLRYELILL